MDVVSLRRVVFAFLASACSVGFATTPADTAAPEKIRAALHARFPDIQVVDIRPSTFAGLYEVFTGDNIAYSDASGEHLFVGQVLETSTRKDLTALRLDDLNAIEWKSLPFDKAIKIVHGTGARNIAIFSDPDCPYCQKLEKDLAAVKDATVFVFLFPLTQIHPKALAHARAIWCSSNRSQAWTQWMLEKKDPGSATCAEDPIDELAALGKKLHVPGTPTLYLSSGQRVTRDLEGGELEQLMAGSDKANSLASASSCKAPQSSTAATCSP